MAELFQTTVPNINLHLKNIFEEGELEHLSTIKDFLIVQKEGKRAVQRKVSHYNLDIIISIGYRVKSKTGTQFRIWANSVLKNYLLKGYALHYRVENLERRVNQHEHQLDFVLKTALPRKEGIFYDGQVFDAYVFVADLIKSAEKSIVLIDNYIDETILLLLAKRSSSVKATVFTKKTDNALLLDIQKYNAQYAAIDVKISTKIHDRFLLVDNAVYHIGASFKDLGSKLFAFSKMEMPADDLLTNIK
jgi:hypothetical protein